MEVDKRSDESCEVAAADSEGDSEADYRDRRSPSGCQWTTKLESGYEYDSDQEDSETCLSDYRDRSQWPTNSGYEYESDPEATCLPDSESYDSVQVDFEDGGNVTGNRLPRQSKRTLPSPASTIQTSSMVSSFFYGEFGNHFCTSCQQRLSYMDSKKPINSGCCLCGKDRCKYFLTCDNTESEPDCPNTNTFYLCHDCAIPKEVTAMVNQYLNQRTIKELVHSSESVFQAMTVPSGTNLILYLTSFIDKDVKTSDLSFLEVGGGKCQLSLCASYVFKRIVAIEISKNITDVVRNCFKELNLFRLVLMNEDVLQIRSFYGKINYNQYIQ